MEAQTQMSTALGFAVLEIPDDVRLADGVAELSADLTSPDGKPLEDVVCVVDLKVTHRAPISHFAHIAVSCLSQSLDRLWLSTYLILSAIKFVHNISAARISYLNRLLALLHNLLEKAVHLRKTR